MTNSKGSVSSNQSLVVGGLPLCRNSDGRRPVKIWAPSDFLSPIRLKRCRTLGRRYHNRAVDSVQVIEELIALAKVISAAKARSAELGLNIEELAFYDALAENGSAKALVAHEQLRILAQVLVQTIRSSATIDWTRKESVRAKMRIEVRKLLARYGYPPDLQRAAVDLVVKQAEVLATAWN